MLALVLFSGCGVATRVSLSMNGSGAGTVAVTVTMDRAALDVLGGLSALKSELSVADARAAGWMVTGPDAVAGGGAVLAARHSFTGPAQAGELVAQIAGPAPFRLVLSRHRTFWHTTYRLTGDVNLTCGLACFGDSGLKASTGSAVGVDPAQWAGQKPSDVFRFVVNARLPGQVRGTNASTRSGSSFEWSPQLGRSLSLAAATETVNGEAVVAVVSTCAVGLIALATWLWFGLFRRRGRHRRRARRRGWRWGRGGTDDPAPTAVAAASPDEGGVTSPE